MMVLRRRLCANIFNEAGAIAAAGGLTGCGTAIFGSLWCALQSNNLTTCGAAPWANHCDIKAAKLLGHHAVALARIGADDLQHDGPERVLAFAPTRSGKGVGLFVPTGPGPARPSSATLRARTGSLPPAGARAFRTACCPTRPMPPQRATIR